MNAAVTSEGSQTELLHPELLRKCAGLAVLPENRTILPQLALYRYQAPTAALPSTYTPSLALVLQGRKQVDLGPTRFVYDNSRFLLTALELPVTSQVLEASAETPYLCLRMTLDLRLVREVLGRAEFQPDDATASPVGMATGAVTPELLDAFSRMVDLLHKPDEAGFMGDLLQREIIFRLLQSQAGQRLRSISTHGDFSHRTAKAVAWIRSHYAQALQVEELAAVAGMAVSTLHYHFRRLTSFSPLQYQKRLRLQEARRRMLIDGLDAASAGFAVGYESASQFNREYSRVFGQSPMRDVRALRRDGGGLLSEEH